MRDRAVSRYVGHELDLFVVTHLQAMTIHLQKRKRDNERDALVPVDEWLILGDSP